MKVLARDPKHIKVSTQWINKITTSLLNKFQKLFICPRMTLHYMNNLIKGRRKEDLEYYIK